MNIVSTSLVCPHIRRVSRQFFPVSSKQHLLGAMSKYAAHRVEHLRPFRSFYAFHLPKSLRDANEDVFASTGVLARAHLEDTTVHGLQNAWKAKGQIYLKKSFVILSSAYYGFNIMYGDSQQAIGCRLNRTVYMSVILLDLTGQSKREDLRY